MGGCACEIAPPASCSSRASRSVWRRWLIAREDPGGSLAGASAHRGERCSSGAGWALVGVGAVAWARRPSSRFGRSSRPRASHGSLSSTTTRGSAPRSSFTVGLLSYAACPPLVAHAALAYPGGRLTSAGSSDSCSASPTGATLLLLGLAAGARVRPCRAGVLAVPGQPPRGHQRPRSPVGPRARIGVWLGLAWALALAGSPRGASRGRRPPRGSSRRRCCSRRVVYLGLVAADYAHSRRPRIPLQRRASTSGSGRGQAAALGRARCSAWCWRGCAAGGPATRWRASWSSLARRPAPGGLRDALARALGDPELQLAYPLDEGRQVDAAGRAIELPQANGRAVTPLVRGGRPVAVLGHRAALLDDPGLLEEVGTAASLALDHERLEAELRAQLERCARRARAPSRPATPSAAGSSATCTTARSSDSSCCRSACVCWATGSAHRQPGASTRQRPSCARRSTTCASSGAASTPPCSPTRGSQRPLDSLAEEGRVPIVVGPVPRERLAPPVEAAAYFLVAEVLKRSRARRVAVSAELSDGRLVVEIAATGSLEDDLTDLEDRIGALDGELTVERSASDRLAVRAEVPCGS